MDFAFLSTVGTVLTGRLCFVGSRRRGVRSRIAGADRVSGGHSLLDALNRPYADADIPCNFTYTQIPAGEGMFDLPFRFPSVRLRPKTIGATS